MSSKHRVEHGGLGNMEEPPRGHTRARYGVCDCVTCEALFWQAPLGINPKVTIVAKLCAVDMAACSVIMKLFRRGRNFGICSEGYLRLVVN